MINDFIMKEVQVSTKKLDALQADEDSGAGIGLRVGMEEEERQQRVDVLMFRLGSLK